MEDYGRQEFAEDSSQLSRSCELLALALRYNELLNTLFFTLFSFYCTRRASFTQLIVRLFDINLELINSKLMFVLSISFVSFENIFVNKNINIYF